MVKYTLHYIENNGDYNVNKTKKIQSQIIPRINDEIELDDGLRVKVKNVIHKSDATILVKAIDSYIVS